MSRRVDVVVKEGNRARSTAHTVDSFPDECPLCHRGIEPIFTEVTHMATEQAGPLQLVFRCPRGDCQSFFIGMYEKSPFSAAFNLIGSAPNVPHDREFSKHISTISPIFCKIVNEAHHAESKGWALVAGPGYRKALEFLVKDYLCRLKPDLSDKIKAAQLGPCIESFVDNDKIKQMAKRAAWLGNDETHYVRKWEDHDLPGLKHLIELTVRWIEMEEMTKQAMKEMPEGKEQS